LQVLEICAGAGGQSLGLEEADFEHVAVVDNDPDACLTLALNRPGWTVLEKAIEDLDGRQFSGVDLLAGGIPCPPFSIAGKQLGEEDERDLFPQVLRLVEEAGPTAVMIENVRGFSGARFAAYRSKLVARFEEMGYHAVWSVLNAANFGVAQFRLRFILVAMKRPYCFRYAWPLGSQSPPTVGRTLHELMREGGWPGAKAWAKAANGIAPTIVGGSKKHGGPDLGPTRAREQWRKLHVDGLGIANIPPGPEFPIDGYPRLTVRMVARIQGFGDHWCFAGSKTAAYRQVGNAFPPPVAAAVGRAIASALRNESINYLSQMPLQQAVGIDS
jgi:DNA (cytosine-5)-methyltransferase 1